VPFNSYWYVVVREDGLYGNYFWERLLLMKPRKLCDWKDIEKIKQKGLFNMTVFRTIVILKNKKKFAITNMGNTPYDTTNYYKTKDQREKDIKYSNRMLYGLIMKMIGEDKFENFKGQFWEHIKLAYNDAAWVIEEDRKLKEKREQWAREEKENKENGQKAE
jgi:hypothetical protein